MNAELLLMFTLGRDRAFLYGHPEYELSAEEESLYDEALAQRSRGIPAQYITGHQEFWGMDFLVSPAVLIPRPETEHVIEAVLGIVKATGEMPVSPQPNFEISTQPNLPIPAQSRFESRGTGVSPIRILDVGTGSGCIALALAKELPQAEIHASDISPAALEVARANAARLQLESRVQFHEIDLLGGIDKNSYDFVVSNPMTGAAISSSVGRASVFASTQSIVYVSLPPHTLPDGATVVHEL